VAHKSQQRGFDGQERVTQTLFMTVSRKELARRVLAFIKKGIPVTDPVSMNFN
jgi:hypothetical protein